jgi:hypothetical protein
MRVAPIGNRLLKQVAVTVPSDVESQNKHGDQLTRTNRRSLYPYGQPLTLTSPLRCRTREIDGSKSADFVWLLEHGFKQFQYRIYL